jgi:hypothetical protein
MARKQIVGIPGVPGAVGVWDDDPADIAAHAANVTTAHGMSNQWFNKYINRGKSFSGIPAGQACWFAEDFTDISRWQKIMGAASMTAVTTLSGGVAEIAPAGADSVDYYNGSVAFGSPTLFLGNGRFYIAARIQIPVAFAGAQWEYVGACDPVNSGYLYIGASTVRDINHWIFYVNDGLGHQEFVSSTVHIDVGWHDLECWCQGAGPYYFAVDGETPVQIAVPTTSLVLPLQPELWAANDTTFRMDKVLYVFPQAV